METREDLIGILLGYGKVNAELYQKREKIRNRINHTKSIFIERDLISLNEELDALNARLKSFSNEGRLFLQFMRLPGFVADHSHPETALLRKKYREQRMRITQLYSKGRILEITLAQLQNVL